MARLILTGMPMPDMLWCAVCAVLAKGQVFADDGVSRRAQEGLADAGRDLVVIGRPEGMTFELQEAVSEGPHPLVGGGLPVPLCWTHLPAVDGTAPPPGQDEAPPPAALYRGPRGKG